MSNLDLKTKIKSLREARQVIEPRTEWLKGNREILMMQIKNNRPLPQASEERQWNLIWVWNFMDVFLPRTVVHYAVRPVFVLLLIFGIAFGGWAGSVSASYNSLPGDVLYPVKLATENMQTSVANKSDATKLRTQFAVRRVEEVKQIVKGNSLKKEEKVGEAVKHLKSDLDQVRGNLEEMKKSEKNTTSAQVVETAKMVNEKTTEIQKTLEITTVQLAAQTPLVSADPLKEQVKDATVAAVATGVKAVEVIVEKHQEDKNNISAADVKTAVGDKLQVLEEKMTKAEATLNTAVASATSSLSGTLNRAEKKDEEKKFAALVDPVKADAASAKEVINQAKTELSKENFDGALDKLKEGSILTRAVEVKTEATQILVTPIAVVTSTLAVPPTVIVPGAVSATGTASGAIIGSVIAPASNSTSGTVSNAVAPVVEPKVETKK